MNKHLRKIAKKVAPQAIIDIIKRPRPKYGRICNAGIPGFIILDPYVKTDRMFNGIQYYSQVYQDYYLDQYVFHEKENGTFLDVGGNDPTYINNTYFFEKNRNWRGLAFEPMPKMNQRWKELRKVECIPAALGRREGEMNFLEYEADYNSGFAREVDFDGKIKSSYKVKVLTLEKVLAQYKINHVDFMSIDVEGAELDVLHGIDFNKVSIDYIVIENNKGWAKERKIRKFLTDHNYELKARLWIDEIWKRKTVHAGMMAENENN